MSSKLHIRIPRSGRWRQQTSQSIRESIGYHASWEHRKVVNNYSAVTIDCRSTRSCQALSRLCIFLNRFFIYFDTQKYVALFSDRWTVHANLDPMLCTASVDFNVPGKPKPPPVTLTATVWTQSHFLPKSTEEKYLIEFTDPTGTLASASAPLNVWVQQGNFSTRIEHGSVPGKCIPDTPLHFKDLSEGDNRQVTLRGNQVTIMSLNSNERLSTCLPVFNIRCSFVVAFCSLG